MKFKPRKEKKKTLRKNQKSPINDVIKIFWLVMNSMVLDRKRFIKHITERK